MKSLMSYLTQKGLSNVSYCGCGSMAGGGRSGVYQSSWRRFAADSRLKCPNLLLSVLDRNSMLSQGGYGCVICARRRVID